ncbi:unnamed protein product [Cuscuta europaea]|uniref:Uncharacterized protein n=1 Tax=Cuscuta europaea TaxID=41803 RepID=A0A9P0YTK2_CUSEU|nr:unnamed protein product [Cuscuta europaea]
MSFSSSSSSPTFHSLPNPIFIVHHKFLLQNGRDELHRRPRPQSPDAHDVLLGEERRDPLLRMAGIRQPRDVHILSGRRFRSIGSSGVVIEFQLLRRGLRESIGRGDAPDGGVCCQNRSGVYCDAGGDVLQRRRLPRCHRRTRARVLPLRERGVQGAAGNFIREEI